MNQRELIERITAEADALHRLGVRSLSLFGSWARDEARETSDVDLLVDFEATPTFDAYMSVKEHLEEVLGRRVDLVTRSALKPRIRGPIEREALRVA